MNRSARCSNAGSERPLYWVSRRAARLSLAILHVCAALTIAVEWILPLSADGHGVDRVAGLDFPASYAVYGFAACVVLVWLGRLLRGLVMRREDYYADARGRDS